MLAKKHQNPYLLECNDCTPKVFLKYDCSKTRLFVAPKAYFAYLEINNILENMHLVNLTT